MTVEILIIVVVSGILLNVITRRVLRHVDAEPWPASEPRPHVQCAEAGVERILAAWGREAGPWSFPETCAPVHHSVQELASRYSEVNFDDIIIAFDRSVVAVYEFNSQFVVIGTYHDDSLILVRRSSDDARIYIVWVEDSDYDEPEVLADRLAEYLFMAEDVHKRK